MKIGMILDAPYPIDPRVTNEANALIKSVFLRLFTSISLK